MMVEVYDLEAGKVYFELLFQDDRLALPIIATYTYLGRSSDEARYEFKVVGKKEVYCAKEVDLKQVMDMDELLKTLTILKRENPELF